MTTALRHQRWYLFFQSDNPRIGTGDDVTCTSCYSTFSAFTRDSRSFFLLVRQNLIASEMWMGEADLQNVPDDRLATHLLDDSHLVVKSRRLLVRDVRRVCETVEFRRYRNLLLEASSLNYDLSCDDALLGENVMGFVYCSQLSPNQDNNTVYVPYYERHFGMSLLNPNVLLDAYSCMLDGTPGYYLASVRPHVCYMCNFISGDFKYDHVVDVYTHPYFDSLRQLFHERRMRRVHQEVRDFDRNKLGRFIASKLTLPKEVLEELRQRFHQQRQGLKLVPATMTTWRYDVVLIVVPENRWGLVQDSHTLVVNTNTWGYFCRSYRSTNEAVGSRAACMRSIYGHQPLMPLLNLTQTYLAVRQDEPQDWSDEQLTRLTLLTPVASTECWRPMVRRHLQQYDEFFWFTAPLKPSFAGKVRNLVYIDNFIDHQQPRRKTQWSSLMDLVMYVARHYNNAELMALLHDTYVYCFPASEARQGMLIASEAMHFETTPFYRRPELFTFLLQDHE